MGNEHSPYIPATVCSAEVVPNGEISVLPMRCCKSILSLIHSFQLCYPSSKDFLCLESSHGWLFRIIYVLSQIISFPARHILLPSYKKSLPCPAQSQSHLFISFPSWNWKLYEIIFTFTYFFWFPLLEFKFIKNRDLVLYFHHVSPEPRSMPGIWHTFNVHSLNDWTNEWMQE